VADGVTAEEWSCYVSGVPPKVKAKNRGPENLAMLRRLTLSTLQRDRSLKDSLRGKRLRAGWDDEVLLQLLTGFSGD
jgi:hypothetical protein